MPKIPFWVFIIVALLHFSSVRVDTMDVDASQYAEISREMMESGSYLEVYDRGEDYLDKPPFLFWVSALSMKVFGVNNFGYKFPSILFALLAIYATYRLAKLLYGDATGRMAALVLAVCQGMFLMTNDVRTDTILMSWVITSLWMIKEWELKCKWHYLFFGAASIACGMMTKGPIALLVPVFCYLSDWGLKRKWKNIFDPYHLLFILVIAVFLIPMSIGLYQQFDMHPEKTVNKLKEVSGLRFFYWSQSFGRITGESPWNNGAGFDFLFSNMLWAFLPWIFLFIPAFIINIIQLVKQKFQLQPNQEWITMGGFILSYIALGSSNYQLPHYIFVVFPLAAIITAKFLQDLFIKKHPTAFKILNPVQAIASGLILVTVLLLLIYVFPLGNIAIVLWASAFIIWLIIILKFRSQAVLWASASAIILANVFLTHHFYHQLLKYQVGSQVGRYISEKNIPTNEVSCDGIDDPLNSIHFYAKGAIAGQRIIPHGYLLTSDEELMRIKEEGLNFEILKQGSFYKVSELTPLFLNMETRPQSLRNYYFIKIN